MEVIVDKTRLYRQTATGKLQVWSIRSEGDTIFIEWGDDGGTQQEQEEYVEDGLAGRSLDEQVLSRINSRIGKKLDQGYLYDKATAAANKPVNRLGLAKPMKAIQLKKARGIDYSTSMLQLKYNGHRCLIHYDGTTYTAYSRNGKIITTVPEIVEAAIQSNMTAGDTLDGELYHHGTKLQTITSWVKRRQPMTQRLVYIVYDIITPMDLYYRARLELINNLNAEMPILIAETQRSCDEDSIPVHLASAIKLGYEGLMLRRDGFPYQDGKRSRGLVKIKAWEDNEYIVEDIIQSKDGYGILICRMKSGIRFRATAPGDFYEKEQVLIYKKEFIGKYVNVQYAELTEAGKPFHPVATGWRDKGNE